MSRGTPERRRDPTTPEGQAIVTAICDATALLLDRDGYEALTTNAIARVAGVSIGSLYQYFPDKRAVVVEVARRLERAALAAATERAATLDPSDPKAATSTMIDVLLDPRLGSLAARRALLLEVPLAWVLPEAAPTDRSTERLVAQAIELLDLREGPRAVMAFVAFHAVEGAIEGAILRRPTWLGEPGFQAELTSLVWRYVAPAGATLSVPQGSEPLPWPEAPDALAARLADEPPPPVVEQTRRAEPSTERGRASVEAILEGMLEVLEEGGWSAASARAVARRAGVSPATLYRYFPDLRAIVAELARRREARLVEMVTDPLTEDGVPLETLLGSLVSELLTRARPRRHARCALIAEVPRSWVRDAAEEATATIERLTQARLEVSPDARGGEPERLAVVAVSAVAHCVESAAVTHPELLDDPRFERELSELAVRYLVDPEGWRAPPT